jgi:hypothetical protein
MNKDSHPTGEQSERRVYALRYRPEKIIWGNMVQRCTNPRSPRWKTYGGKGVHVCDRWLGEDGFERFLADMGERPSPEHQLRRHDTGGDFCPENCAWVRIGGEAG